MTVFQMKVLRQSTGLTQEHFASIINVSPSLIKAIEAEQRKLSQRTIRRIEDEIKPELLELAAKIAAIRNEA